MVLRRFLYLDEDAVRGYLSALEDGQREGGEQTSSGESGGDIGGALGPIKGTYKKGTKIGESATTVDTAEAKFNRLALLADEDDYYEVLEADQLAASAVGHIIEVDAEVWVPDVIKAFTGASELRGLVDLFGKFSAMTGSNAGPSPDEVAKVESTIELAASANMRTSVVGDVDDGWKVFGRITDQFLRVGELEGDVRIVGKVVKVVRSGQRRLIVDMPGVAALGRQKRREMETAPPSPKTADYFVEGPAVELDILAIYR